MALTERPLEAVLFDLDGTLLDTAPDLIDCANELLLEHGRTPLSAGYFGTIASHGSAAIVRRGFNLEPDDPAMAELGKRYLALYLSRISRLTLPYPGMAETLEALEQRGVLWGVVTNKPASLTEPLMQALGLSPRAACIVSGDTTAHSKPHPAPVLHACELMGVAPARTAMVGDAMRDIVAGQAAGCLTLAALFGYICAEDEPARWGADGLLGHPLELLRWLGTVGDEDVHGFR